MSGFGRVAPAAPVDRASGSGAAAVSEAVGPPTLPADAPMGQQAELPALVDAAEVEALPDFDDFFPANGWAEDVTDG